jgi:hypothetical protein
MYINADMRGASTILLALDGVLVGLIVEADTQEGWMRRYDTRQLDYDVLSGNVAGITARVPASNGSFASFDFVAVTEAHAAYCQRLTTCPVTRTEGKVDFVGDTATDPDWMIAQRMVAIRHKLGMKPWLEPPLRMEGVVPGLLEWTAVRLRTGELAYANMQQSRKCDQFPLPDGSVRPIHNGRGSLAVDFVDVAVQKDYEVAKAKWAVENPDLVPEYVRSRTEGPIAIGK